jgi:hypothetical protein
MAQKQSSAPERRNGKLSIPLPFDEAVKAALEVEQPERIKAASEKRRPRQGKRSPKT